MGENNSIPFPLTLAVNFGFLKGLKYLEIQMMIFL
jgi:hypothetical protein